MISLRVKDQTIILDKNFYRDIIKEPEELKFNVNKILVYKGSKLAHLVLEYNKRNLSDSQIYRSRNKNDFRNEEIYVLEKVTKPSQMFLDLSTISSSDEIFVENKLLKWNIHAYAKKEIIYLIWKHRENDVEVHGIVDRNIMNDRRIELGRLYPKYRPNVDKYYIYHRSHILHRLLLRTPAELDVDHINLITTDNRVQNIRNVSNRENILNRGVFKSSSTGIKGVMPSRRNGIIIAFISEIVVNGETKTRSFSVFKYGHMEALRMAIDQREVWNKQYNYRSSTRQSR